MKVSLLLTGLGICLGATGFANADIWTGTTDGYFTQMYATDLSGTSALSQYNSQCNSKYWYLMNTPFHVDFRVNTQGMAIAFLSFANAETALNGVFDKNSGGYAFKSDQIAQAHKDIHIQSLFYSINSQFNRAYAKLVLEGGNALPPTPPNPNPPLPTPSDANCSDHCDDKNTVQYQCVLATY